MNNNIDHDPAVTERTGITREVAAFASQASLQAISRATLDLAKKSIADGLFVALAGTTTPLARALAQYTAPYSARRGDRQPGWIGSDLPPRFAAMLLGSTMHACEFDDVYLGAKDRDLGLHATAAVLPAVLAMGRAVDCSGAELVLSYIVGVEAGCRIFDATAREHVLNGLHSLGTCGVMGAAVGVAQLRHASADEICTALGIAASFAGGVREHFGTMMKPFHAGKAAEGGVVAVELMEAGMTAATNVLEADRGFFRALGGGCDPARIHGRLGNPPVFEDRGVWLKPWPCGGLSHPAITALCRLAREERIDITDVEQIAVQTTNGTFNTLIHHQPRSGDQAKFSMEFCCVAPFLFQEIGLAEFSDETVRSTRVQSAIRRVQYSPFSDSERQSSGYGILTTLLNVRLTDGRTFAIEVDECLGGPQRPMAWADVVAKGEGCLAYAGLDPALAVRIAEVVEDIERHATLGPLRDAIGGRLD